MTEALNAALHQMAQSDWPKQETCYVTLLKLLKNIVEHPAEAKFRHLKMQNAALKAKVFDLPGALDFLRSVGFQEVENGEALECSAPADQVKAARDRLEKHADDAKMNELRRERDAKIAEEKAKAKKDPFTCHKELATTEEEREALRKELERDRLEMAAELAHRGPTQASKATGHRPQVRCARGGHQLHQEGRRLSLSAAGHASSS